MADLAFAVLANKGRALMYRASIPYEMRFKVWREAFQTATLLNGLVPIKLNGKVATRYKHWGEPNP